nr:hypothetical protein [uncultured Flavobacterium sp.]
MQKQKYISFLLAVILMFSNVGLAINIHYCKDAIAEVAFDFLSESKLTSLQEEKSEICCGKKKTTENDEPCCKDEVVKQKVDENQIATNSVQFQVNNFLAPVIYQLVIPETFELQIPKNTFVQFYCESNAPPLYKLYRKLVYYA